jgi:hypothetical protein
VDEFSRLALRRFDIAEEKLGRDSGKEFAVCAGTRGLQDEVQFELRRGGASGLAVDQSAV